MNFFHLGRNESGHERGPGKRRRHRHGQTGPLTLDCIRYGDRFRVVHLTAVGEIRQRLLDMGFIRGAAGRVLRAALMRDPIELEMNGFKVSLRLAEARDIVVEDLE